MEYVDACIWCGIEHPHAAMTHSDHHGGMVCATCRADQGPKTLGEIITDRKAMAVQALVNKQDAGHR